MTANVLDLRDAHSADPAITGAKAANLARAGMDVLPGFVVTTNAVLAGFDDPTVMSDLRRAWSDLHGEGKAALVVRSSSTIEDAGTSSMAGQFTSVPDVSGWPEFEQAVRRVAASARLVPDGSGEIPPLAVLVQRQLESPAGHGRRSEHRPEAHATP